MYECAACGRKYKAIQTDWVKQLDADSMKVLWHCPNCGRLQKDRARFMHDKELDYKPRKER